ncbi:MAG TPA: ABC transporter permease/substrate-binding protein [Povalibacter sp.]|uniref:ABC transporter permease/substrate-binding protein n=1 Tax=Povalibacter sp. TaxID=1962978 RepID=UPI002BB2B6CF|nr:ABC transporter permease/substrate-binding protein [Povalibacter sp.]HMN44220.1 ABC transporter permease/substrate-binding protein [Povalibacter sp.]
MNDAWPAAWRLLPGYLGEHIILSASALALGLAISLPLTVLAVRRTRIRWLILAMASIVQTIPSLALLALFYPLLLMLSALSLRLFGHGFAALGFLPSLLALTLYSMLPILRNGVASIVTLPPAVIEAARGVGMTDWQRLWRIELPLAAPMLMAGIRTAAVWVIGTATLSTPVGQTSLGNYIFAGLQVQNWVSVLFGCIAAAVLALIVDQLLALIESGTAKRSRWRIVAGATALLAGVAIAALPRTTSSESQAYVIGAKNFSEQYILADLLAQRLQQAGASTTQRTGLGSMIAFQALARDELDVYVEYTGTLWANVMHRTDSPPREIVLQETAAWLQQRHGITLLGSLGFENAYALAMRRDRAQQLGIRTLEDLARNAAQLRMGGDLEFFDRPEWSAVKRAYGLVFAAERQFQPTFMYRAVGSGEVDVISAFSSDGRIAADDLVLLEDPRQALLSYDAIVLLAPRRAADVVLRRTLEPLIGAIPIETMRQANLSVDRDTEKSTAEAAARWLNERL